MDRPPCNAAGPLIVVVIGVSGSGKTTIARLLAGRLGWPFVEGDDFHPAANRAKMASGTPLDDADRQPWLAAIARQIDHWRGAGQSGAIACSALKRSYRDLLAGGRPELRFVFLAVGRDVAARRIAQRRGHFMPVQLIDSQFAALEPPAADEPAHEVAADAPPAAIVDRILAWLAPGRDAPYG